MPSNNSSVPADAGRRVRRESSDGTACAPALEAQHALPLRLASTAPGSGSNATADSAKIAAALRQVSSFVAAAAPSCNDNSIAFAQAGKAIVGLYVGARIQRQGVTATVLERVLSRLEASAVSSTASEPFLVELCDPDAEYGADYTAGLVINTEGDVDSVRQTVRSWSKGSCLAGPSSDVLGEKLAVLVPAPSSAMLAGGPALNGSTPSSNTTLPSFRVRGLDRRQSYCSNVKEVVSTFTRR